MTRPRPAAVRILVTRREEQSGDLVAGLALLGAQPLVVPAIELAPPADCGPLDAAIGSLASYDWMALTSANAVRFVARRLAELCVPAGTPPRIASVGPATGAMIRSLLGRAPDLEPPLDFQAQALAELLAAHGGASRLLLPTSDQAGDTLPEALRARGWHVDVVVAYRTCPATGLAERLAALGDVDLVVFASPSAVAAVASAAPSRVSALPAAVIGPVTERAALEAGFAVRLVAEPSTVSGLLEGVRGWLASLDRSS